MRSNTIMAWRWGMRSEATSIGTIAAHMRMHTAQHLISGLAYEMFGVRMRWATRSVRIEVAST